MTYDSFRSRGIVTLILAAGNSSRLKSPKQLIRFQSQTLIQRICSQIAVELDGACFITLGANSADCAHEISGLAVKIVHNVNWSQGIGGSIAIGIKEILRSSKNPPIGILLCLADQPLISTQYLLQLANLYRTHGTGLAASYYNDIRGVPAIFSSKYYDALLNLSGNNGAKEVIRQATDGVCLPCDSASFDIDLAGDVIALKKLEDDGYRP